MKYSLQQITNGFFSSKWKQLLFIFIIGFILFVPSLNFDYSYLDDNALIKDNFYKLENISHIVQGFKEGVFPRSSNNDTYYRPLLTTSFVIDAQFSDGVSLESFHFTNIILHLLSACLLYLILLKLKIKEGLSFLFSLLFVIHPLNVHAVAWIPGRNDTLLTIFFLSAFLSFLSYLKSKKLWQYILYILFFILSLLTKETALAFPILILLYLYLIYKEKILSKFSIINIFLLLTTTLAWLALHSQIIGKSLANDYNIIYSLFTNSPAIFGYLGKLVFVHNLSVFPSMSDLPLIFGIIVFIAIILLLYFSKNKNWSYILFGTLWFSGTLAPSLIKNISNDTQLADFAEHRVYLALVGLIIVLSQINIPINHNKVPRKIIIAIVTIMTILLFIISLNHEQVYKNKISFWSNAVKYSPSSAFNANNLGAMYYLDMQYDLAEKYWLKAYKLNPNEKLVQNNLGLIYSIQGKYDKAYDAYMKELKINPNYTNAHFNLGLLFYNEGKIDEAITEWKKTIELDPEYFSAYKNLINYYISINDLEQAKYYKSITDKMGVDIGIKIPE